MPYTYKQIFAADPNNTSNVASNTSILLFDPADASKTPITITGVTGEPIPNPVPVNRNGWGPAFQHPTLDRIAWAGGGFDGYFTSYEGMKDEAVAARQAAQEAATNAAATATVRLDELIADGQFKGEKGADGVNGANVLPTQEAIEQAIINPGPAKTAIATDYAANVANRTRALTTVTSGVPRSPFSIFKSAQTRDDLAVVIGSSTGSQMAGTLATVLSPLGITVQNAGVSGERGRWTEARIGSDPLVLTFPNNTIPASGAVTVTLQGDLPGGTMNAIPGRVESIAGTVSVSGSTVTWTRTTSGTAVGVSGPVQHIPVEGETYRDALHIIVSAYKNSMGTTGADTAAVAGVNRMIEHIAAQDKRFIVVTPFCDTNTVAGLEKTQIESVVRQWKEMYAPVCFDLSGYLTGSQVWTDTGITPTATDTTQQAAGNLPPSLANDTQHMKAATATAASTRIRDMLTGLGWYTLPVNPMYTSDSFSTGSGTVIGRTSDAALGGSGATWTGTASSWNVTNGALVDGSTAASFVGFTSPSPDAEISATIKVLPTTSSMILAWRRTDADNLYRISISTTGSLNLTKRVAATTSTVAAATGAYGSVAVNDVLTVRMVGSAITILVNGAVRATATDASHVNAASIGLGSIAATGGASVDDVKVRQITDASAL